MKIFKNPQKWSASFVLRWFVPNEHLWYRICSIEKCYTKFLSLQILVSITSWCRSGLQTVLGRFPLTEHEEFTGFSSLVSMLNRLYLRAPTTVFNVQTCVEKLRSQFVHFRGVLCYPPPLSDQKSTESEREFRQFGRAPAHSWPSAQYMKTGL